jgi:uncharacterized delta-60 repeat protein
VTTEFGHADQIRALSVQPDGKLLAAGYTYAKFFFAGISDFALARYQPDGSLDPTFGTGGLVTTDLGGEDVISALVLQRDGRLIAAGSAGWTRYNSSAAVGPYILARYEAVDVLVAFVTDVYQVALGRLPDAMEVSYWVAVLTTDPTPNTVRGMLHVVFDGPEFRQRPLNPWQYVEAIYQAMLGRAPAPAELDWWVQQVLDRYNTLLPGFVDAPEFQRLVSSCRDAGAVSLLVGRLYLYALGRGGTPAELTWWTQAIVSGCAIDEGLEDFFNSLEYLAVPRTLATHVTVLYRALLAREPDAGEQAWWVDYLAGQLAAVEDDVMASAKFEVRVYRLFP